MKLNVKLKIMFFPLLLAPLLTISSISLAQEKGDFIVSILSMKMSPADNNAAITSDVLGVLPDAALLVEDESLGAIGLTYFLSDRVAFEAYVAFPPEPKVTSKGLDALGVKEVATVSVAPITAIFQYHLPLANSRFAIHAGFGLAYVHFYDIEVDGTVKAVDPNLTFDADDTFATVFQLGGQWNFTEKLSARFTYGKMFFDGDTIIQSELPLLGKLTTNVKVDPAMTIVGFGYRF
ncbi:MAG: outer membrane beta-barrel protein [Pseudomonadales bacterium]|nr:outer membrane beta-barrel protein [Pseudomonadales bacterium]